jgi:hypothetical protein
VQHGTPRHGTAALYGAMECGGVQCSPTEDSECSAAALAGSDRSIVDGRRIVTMDGGEWMAGNSLLRLREDSRRAANSSPARCSGVQCNVISPAHCRAVESSAARCRAVEGNGSQWSVVVCNGMQWNAMECGALQLQLPAATAQVEMADER